MIGDVIGKPGRQALERLLPQMRDERGIDLVTANGENLAGGMGLTPATAQTLYDTGVDVITSGNHIWDKKEIIPELDRDERILRPINYGQDGVPGRGWGIFHAVDGTEVVVISAQGRTYMQPIENPFTDVGAAARGGRRRAAPGAPGRLPLRDLRARRPPSGSTSTGRSARSWAPTPTCPPRIDRILPRGTAFVCDLGMTGPIDSVIGFAPETVLPRFINGLPTRFEVGSGPVVVNALLIDIAPGEGGRAVAVERISRMVDV